MPLPVSDTVVATLGPGGILALNIGARWGDMGAWWRIDPLVAVVGFEPDPAECDRLNALCPDPRRERYLPLALGAEPRDAPLYVTSNPACSSLYAPLETLIDRYPALEQFRIVEKRMVRLTRLDDWWEAEHRPRVDFIKIDTQGSELDILRGASALLGDCVGCEVEVEFSALYAGQPLFADVDAFMRERGFVLWRLKELEHYSERPPLPGEQGRLYWTNAVYLRDDRELGSTDKDRRKRLVLAALLEALNDLSAARSCLGRAIREPTGKTPST